MHARTQVFLASCFASGALTLLGLLLFVPSAGIPDIAITTLAVVAATGLVSYFWHDLPAAIRAVPGAFRVAAPAVARGLREATASVASRLAERGRRFSRLFFRSRPLFQIPAAAAVAGWTAIVLFGVSRITLFGIPWAHPMMQAALIGVPVFFGGWAAYAFAFASDNRYNDYEEPRVLLVFLAYPIYALWGIASFIGAIALEGRSGRKWSGTNPAGPFYDRCFFCDDGPHSFYHKDDHYCSTFRKYALARLSYRQGLAYYGDALTNIGIGLATVCLATAVGLAWYFPRAIARFIAELFIAIHSAERLMVAVDGPLGGLVAYAALRLALGGDLRALPVVFQLGFVALGGLAALALGYLNYTLIARGLPRLSPAPLRTPSSSR